MRVNMVVVAADSALAPYDITCTINPHSCHCLVVLCLCRSSLMAGHAAMVLFMKEVIIQLTHITLCHQYTTLYHQCTKS